MEMNGKSNIPMFSSFCFLFTFFDRFSISHLDLPPVLPLLEFLRKRESITVVALVLSKPHESSFLTVFTRHSISECDRRNSSNHLTFPRSK
jgi:hypothetical protein